MTASKPAGNIRDFDPATAAELYEGGLSIRKITEKFNAFGRCATETTVRAALLALGVVLRTHSEAGRLCWQDPKVRARHQDAVEMAARRVDIPHWVPSDLREDYWDFALELGEEAAASVVRRLKAEGARP